MNRADEIYTEPLTELLPNADQKHLQMEKSWDLAGIIIGLMGCAAQLSQVISEWQRTEPSGLSLSFVLGYALVFAFWLAYGLFFKRPAIIITNAIALILQTLLLSALW